ncbi:hypothetical protein [uncultured Helicobacter sp.]|uniref:hypothetical protein n=1 Tax=uncultured Helicobacter sp. TaxID=175537 RepID=UPI0025EE44E4|nr:hypothetical protein [uncultured Helicobacter sp.]
MRIHTDPLDKPKQMRFYPSGICPFAKGCMAAKRGLTLRANINYAVVKPPSRRNDG